MKTSILTKVILFFTLSILFISCEEEGSGSGNYIIGVSNSTSKNYSISVTLDGVNQGSFIVKATQQGNYSSLCGDLVHAATLDNVLILNYVSSGDHTLVLKDSSTGFVFITDKFKMKGDCISQQYNF
jgi:hypothetical protein